MHNTPSIERDVAVIDDALNRILDALSQNLHAETFAANVKAFTQLETAFNTKSLIDAAIARLAELANAGDLVGSTKHADYLTRNLGISRSEAHKRRQRSDFYFGEVQPPALLNVEDPVERKQQQRDAVDVATAARDEALNKTRQLRLSSETQQIISTELRHLNRDAEQSKQALFLAATEQASTRIPEDLKAWVRREVKEANKTTKDVHAGWRKRRLHFGNVDTDGGAVINGYLPADTLALMKAALSPACRPAHGSTQDRRTVPQRRVDMLTEILKNHNASKKTTSGVGSIVISLSAKDIDVMDSVDPGTRYPTNTGVSLSALDILRLGMAKYDAAIVLDADSGRPLHAARTKRSATLLQKLALLASELVCSEPDCAVPMVECDIHHVQPWLRGGQTDIENLTLKCRHHHTNNDDSHSGIRGRTYAATDKRTGRIGVCYPNGGEVVHLNESVAQQESRGAQTRGQPWPG